jgi:predicted enzyme related to lactoylglutathione lyase
MQHHKINYVEFPCQDLARTKAFFELVFAWQFTDYGPDYSVFSDEGVDGGFYQSEQQARCASGSALVVFFSDDLEQSLKAVEQAGGQIIVPPFEFPGGRRFHFIEPSGNEFAIWSLNN